METITSPIYSPSHSEQIDVNQNIFQVPNNIKRQIEEFQKSSQDPEDSHITQFYLIDQMHLLKADNSHSNHFITKI